MRILYFDCFAGISGDMTVAALISAGLPIDYLTTELKKLGLTGYHLHVAPLERSMISAVKFDVHVADHAHNHEHDAHQHDGHQHDAQSQHTHHHAHDAMHHHMHLEGDHTHSHGHESTGTPVIDEEFDEQLSADTHNHSHGRTHHEHGHSDHEVASEQHVHTHGLSFRQIIDLIDSSTLATRVKSRATAIFTEIAKAESAIHGVELSQVHFHEVGSVDSIVDIVSTAIGLEYFEIDECRSRAVPLGAGGFIRTAHGVMPIPTPATLEIMVNYPTIPGREESEMTTPTGAGIVKALSRGLMSESTVLTPIATGYGAGTKEFISIPNLLRIVIGEVNSKSSTSFTERDTIQQLTTTIDDMTGQQLAYLHERLMSVGALDVYFRPITMKKSRPAHEVIVLGRMGSVETLLEVLAKESTTIGVRVEQVDRRLAKRESVLHDHPTFGSIRLKRIESELSHVRFEPEFDDVKRIAQEMGLSHREVEHLIRHSLFAREVLPAPDRPE